MASEKDTFEPDTFAANTFASGTWRGGGVDEVPLIAGQTSVTLTGPGQASATRVGLGQADVDIGGQ